MYNGEYTPLECLSVFGNRDRIEKAFRIMKMDLNILPVMGEVSSGLMHKYSVEKMQLE